MQAEEPVQCRIIDRRAAKQQCLDGFSDKRDGAEQTCNDGCAPERHLAPRQNIAHERRAHH